MMLQNTILANFSDGPSLNQTCDPQPSLFFSDYLVLVSLLTISMIIGVYYAWTGREDDKEEYLLGGRKMRTIPVTMSLLASFMSPVTFVGLPVEVYQRGTSIWVSILGFFVTNAVAAEVFVPIFYRLKITSVNTYLALRFDSTKLSTIASIMSVVAIIPWMGVVLYSSSLVLSTTTGLSTNASVLLTGFLVTMYTSIGGLKAVVWTDVVQFTLMVLGITIVIVKGTSDVGGPLEAWRRARVGGRIEIFRMDPNPYLPNNVWVILLGTIVNWGGSFSASQMLVQRACALPSLKSAKTVMYLALPGLQLLTLMLCFLGIVVYAFYYKCDPFIGQLVRQQDAVLPRFVTETFGEQSYGISGLFIACICSASLSTLSSGLNSMSTLIWEDWLGSVLPPLTPITEVFCTKVIVILLGLVLMAMAFVSASLGTIFEVSYALSGAPVGPLFALFLVAMFFPNVDGRGALSGFVAGELACLFVLIGQYASNYPSPVLPASTEDCPLACDGRNVSLFGRPVDTLSSATLYSPPPSTSLDYIFQITHFLIPVVGFVVTVIISLFVSMTFPSATKKPVDAHLVHAKVIKMFCPNTRAIASSQSSRNVELEQAPPVASSK